MSLGSKRWVFPDGDLPPLEPYDSRLKNNETHGHESLVILNSGTHTVNPTLTVYFPESEPLELKLSPIPPQRVRCYRTDEPLGLEGTNLPTGQYALVVECEHPVVAQIGRMDVRQPNLAYYTVMGFPA